MSIWDKIKYFARSYYKDVVVGFIVFTVAWVLILRVLYPPVTTLMIKRMLSDDGKGLSYTWKSTNEISPYIRVCAMASEDQNLPFHYGMDLEAIDKALNVNKRGKKVFGASTITQQVAKNVFLFPQRSYIRKGLELYFTLLIETLWTKQRTLEMYLNVAEMGDMVFGVEAAAQSYFNKSAQKLSLSESALIISVLPNPIKYSVKKPGPYVGERQQQITSLYHSLDGTNYLRELYIKTENSLYDFRKYKK
jgi:monofunctional glycosyltransferase